MSVVMLDCTLRDGGYYNNWDFDKPLVERYLIAMAAAGIDYVELGLRGFPRPGFWGPYAFTRDDHLRDLNLPAGPRYGVMVNASELLGCAEGALSAVSQLFAPAADSPVELARLACHAREVSQVLDVCHWLKDQGYRVGLNVMQAAECRADELEALAALIPTEAVDVLYFADSTGGLDPRQTESIVDILRRRWSGALGIHAHDNRTLAHANSMRAIEAGVTWVDSTVTGMGRGPGNAKTEYLALELAEQRVGTNSAPLLKLVAKDFLPMQQRFGWGTNSHYYLAGKYGIHPTYVQEMLGDARYRDTDVAMTIEALKRRGARTFSPDTLAAARHFYYGEVCGTWAPREALAGRKALVLGVGPGVERHRDAIQRYIRRTKPLVLALNTSTTLDEALIDMRVVCHPLRLMADLQAYTSLTQHVVTPFSMLPEAVRNTLAGQQVLDFGIDVQPGTFGFHEMHCIVPNSLALSYALAFLACGGVSQIMLAGFDGYPGDDARNLELDQTLALFQASAGAPPLLAITQTRLQMPKTSIYAL